MIQQIDEGGASKNRVYLEKLSHSEYRLHARRHTYSLINAARRSIEVIPCPRGLGANACQSMFLFEPIFDKRG